MTAYRDKLDGIRIKINAAAQRVGRDPREITLLAVSKRKSVEDIETVFGLGQQLFAENYLQEAHGKIAAIDAAIEWHFIGHIQSKKVKQIAEMFHVVHTIDRLKIAKLLENKLAQLNKVMRVYIQVNIGREPQKSGVAPEELSELVREVLKLPHLRFVGLMAMPPFSHDPEDSRPFFKEMRLLAEELYRGNGVAAQDNIGLSMGMSGDYETAIEEGATIVRVGTALFGERA